MNKKPYINPIIEKLINGNKDDKELFNKINNGHPFYIGGRKYKLNK